MSLYKNSVEATQELQNIVNSVRTSDAKLSDAALAITDASKALQAAANEAAQQKKSLVTQLDNLSYKVDNSTQHVVNSSERENNELRKAFENNFEYLSKAIIANQDQSKRMWEEHQAKTTQSIAKLTKIQVITLCMLTTNLLATAYFLVAKEVISL